MNFGWAVWTPEGRGEVWQQVVFHLPLFENTFRRRGSEEKPLHNSLSQGLVSKNLVFLDVKKAVVLQEAMVSMSVAQYSRYHGCLRFSGNVSRFGLISRGPQGKENAKHLAALWVRQEIPLFLFPCKEYEILDPNFHSPILEQFL